MVASVHFSLCSSSFCPVLRVHMGSLWHKREGEAHVLCACVYLGCFLEVWWAKSRSRNAEPCDRQVSSAGWAVAFLVAVVAHGEANGTSCLSRARFTQLMPAQGVGSRESRGLHHESRPWAVLKTLICPMPPSLRSPLCPRGRRKLWVENPGQVDTLLVSSNA